MKRMGPKIDPWETPQEEDKVGEEVEPEMTERAYLIDKTWASCVQNPWYQNRKWDDWEESHDRWCRQQLLGQGRDIGNIDVRKMQ